MLHYPEEEVEWRKDIGIDGPHGYQYFYKLNEVLVLEEDVEELRRELDSDEVDVAAGVVRLRIAGQHIPSLVQRFHARGTGRRPYVAPNYVFVAAHPPPKYPHRHGGSPQSPKPVTAPLDYWPPYEQSQRMVSVGVLDSGIVDHPLLQGKFQTVNSYDSDLEVLDSNHDGRLDDEAGHGTFVAGLISIRAPEAKLQVARVMDSSGIVEEFELIQALERERIRGCQLLNMSFGGYSLDDQPPLGMVAALSRRSDTVAVAAAGNDASDRPFWPAALSDVVGVAAVGPNGQRAAFSNFGSWVDVSAPGVDIVSTFVTFDEPDRRFDGVAQWSGTSAATGQVTGTLARLMSERNLNAREAISTLYEQPETRRMPGLGVVLAN